MINHSDIGATVWRGKAINLPEQGGARATNGLFQQYLDNSNSEAPPETLSPDTIRTLASNLVAALERAGMHAMFSDADDSQSGETAGLLSTDLFMAIRNSVRAPLISGQERLANLPVSPSESDVPAVEAHSADHMGGKPASGEEQYASIIASAAAANGLDPKLIESVIRTESDFNAEAQSPVGAQGLMQLMPETAAELGVADPFDPAENIQAGSRYLKRLMNRYHGDTKLALAAYNWGMGNLERHPERMPQETVHYVAKITGLMNNAV